MSDKLEPFVHIQFEIMLKRRQEVTTAPPSSLSMSDGMTNRASRREKEKVDVRVDLADNSKVDVEVSVEGLDGNIGSQTTILPLVTKRVRFQLPAPRLHHQDYRIQDSGDGCRG